MESSFIVFTLSLLFHQYHSALVVKEKIKDIHLEKYEDFEFTFGSSSFENDGNSLIYLSLEENEWVTTTYKSPSMIFENFYINTRSLVILDGIYSVLSDYEFGIHILDFRNLSNIERLSSISVREGANGVCVDGNYLYISSSGDVAITIYDIEDMTSPKFVSRYIDNDADYFNLLKVDDVVYASTSKGLRFIDVTNIESPSYIGKYSSSYVSNAVIRGDVAFLAMGSSGLYTVNISNLETPVYLDNYDPGGTQCRGIAVNEEGTYVYMADLSAFRVISALDPTNLNHAWSETGLSGVVDVHFYTPTIVAVREVDILLYDVTVPNSPVRLNGFGDTLPGVKIFCDEISALCYNGYYYGMTVYDVSDPYNPALKQISSDFFGGAALRLQLFGKYLFVADDNYGLKVLEIAFGKAFFPVVYRYETSEIVDLVVDYPWLYSIGNQKLIVMNFTINSEGDIEVVNEVSEFDIGEVVTTLFVQGDTVFLGSNKGFRFIDVSNREFPVQVFSHSGKFGVVDCISSKRIVFDNDLLYFACADQCVVILNVTTSPSWNVSLFTYIDYSFKGMHSITVDDRYFYVAGGDIGVDVYKKPTREGEECEHVQGFSYGSARDVTINGNFAWISDDNCLIHVVDISDMMNVVMIPDDFQYRIDADYDSRSCVVKDNIAFVADGNLGVKVVEVDLKMLGKKNKFDHFCGETEVKIRVASTTNYTNSTLKFKISREDYCNGNGKCLENFKCSCDKDFEGDQCGSWSCYGVNNVEASSEVCSGHGMCESKDKCKCDQGYYFNSYFGKECSQTLTYYTVIAPAGIITILSLILCVLSAFLCLCISFCFCFFFLICCLCGSVCFLFRSCLKLKKYGKLRDIDLLLKEQQHDEDTTVAHLRINRELFEIPFEEINTLSIIGEGGSNAIVFKAKWNGMFVAFKCFRTRSIMASQDKFNEFEREVEILGSLSHPFIIRFFGATLKPPRTGIVMEYAGKGEILDFIIKFRSESGSAYPLFQKLRLLFEVSSAIQFLHSKNIIHRDLKSENVLIDEKENAKLMDFGVSRLVDSMAVTKTLRVGTSVYMAPEIVTDDHYTEKCDVFSFAILAYVVISETSMPYDGEEFQIEMKVANDPEYRPSIEKLEEILQNQEINGTNDEYDWIIKMIQKCWGHDPEKRYSFKKLSKILEKGYKDYESKEIGEAKKDNEEVRDLESDDGSDSDDDGNGTNNYEEMSRKKLICRVKDMKEEIYRLRKKKKKKKKKKRKTRKKD